VTKTKLSFMNTPTRALRVNWFRLMMTCAMANMVASTPGGITWDMMIFDGNIVIDFSKITAIGPQITYKTRFGIRPSFSFKAIARKIEIANM